MQYQYDVIVIGSGPGGEGAAMKCAKDGKRVAVVDEFFTVGGRCTHTGTIPSKALRFAVQMVSERGSYEDAGYTQLLKASEEVVEQQVKLRHSFYTRNDVDVINGRAAFIDEHTVEISSPESGKEQFTSAAFILATGSRPYHPPDIDFSSPYIVDSDTVLRMENTPKVMAIYGAGVIGCEYACIFRGLRIKINLINTHDRLLTFLDDEISDALSYHLRENGVLIRNNEEYEKVEAGDNGVTIFLKSKKQIKCDILLWAQGRTGNSDNMGLENIGIKTNVRGSIETDKNYRTAQPHIYAVGDVVGFPSLASAAYDQGRFAATHLVHGTCEFKLVEDIPAGIYTIPEISSIGCTEQELTAKQIPYEVGHSFFRHLARAQITGRTTGMLKILFHRESLEILGIHCFGSQASEIIHIGQAIMAQEGKSNNLMYFINTTFNYPTMAEAYRVAALNGYNRLR
jgi:NAD(P) transhydrogenase